MANRSKLIGIVFLCVASAAPSLSAQQSEEQQACINRINKDGANVAKAQAGEAMRCLKEAGKGNLAGTAQACLTADAKGKVQKKQDKLTADVTEYCTSAPSFGFTSAAVVADAAIQGQLDLIEDIFTADLDDAVLACDSNAAFCKCQNTVLKAVHTLAATKISEFNKCKKAALKAGANAAAVLEDCVDDNSVEGSVAADSKGKIQKKIDKLNEIIVKNCDSPGVSGAFPGDCTSLSNGALGACLDKSVECRVCEIINTMDGLNVDCDLFDNATADTSCENVVGPTRTPTVTPTHTPTRTPTAQPSPTPSVDPSATYRGSLLRSNGIWTYSGTPGQPGAETACNNSFAGSHVCSINELLTAEAAGELVGAKDIGNNTINTFWAVDAGATDANQCVGPTIRWDYGTVHTGAHGNAVSLTNATGDLGPVTSQNCTSMRWVACCQ